MADKDPNITIDISGNTASMATDFHAAGVGLTNAHAQIMKVAWGDSDTTERVTSNRPLPVQIQGGTGALEVSVVTSPGITYHRNRNYSWAAEGNPEALDGITANSSIEYLAVAGSTYGSNLEVVAFGLPGATAVAVTGDVRLPADSVIRMVGVTASLYVGNQFSPGDVIAGGVTGPLYHPVAITGGRNLNYETDSIRIDNTTIGISGGRVLTASTDAVKVYGSDGGNFVKTNIFNTDGTTLGFSGDYAKVWIGGADINATVNVSSTVGVTNGAPQFSPLRVQGFTAGSGHDPVIIRGENAGAVEVFSNNNLNTNVTNTVNINDTEIITAMTDQNGALVSNLNDIKENTAPIFNIRGDLTSGNMRARVESDPPSNIYSGSVIVTNSAQQLGTNTTLRSGVNIKNSPSSSSDVVIGGRNIGQSANNGYILEPGESIFMEIDNVNKIFVRASAGLTPATGGSARIVFIGS